MIVVVVIEMSMCMFTVMYTVKGIVWMSLIFTTQYKLLLEVILPDYMHIYVRSLL